MRLQTCWNRMEVSYFIGQKYPTLSHGCNQRSLNVLNFEESSVVISQCQRSESCFMVLHISWLEKVYSAWIIKFRREKHASCIRDFSSIILKSNIVLITFILKFTFLFLRLQVNWIPKCICLILIVITCDDVGTYFMFWSFNLKVIIEHFNPVPFVFYKCHCTEQWM